MHIEYNHVITYWGGESKAGRKSPPFSHLLLRLHVAYNSIQFNSIQQMLVDYPETSAPLTGFWRGHKVAQIWTLQRLGNFLPWWSSTPFVLLLRVQSDSGSQTFRQSAEHLGLNSLWVFQGAPKCPCGYMSICTGPLGQEPSPCLSSSHYQPLEPHFWNFHL